MLSVKGLSRVEQQKGKRRVRREEEKSGRGKDWTRAWNAEGVWEEELSKDKSVGAKEQEWKRERERWDPHGRWKREEDLREGKGGSGATRKEQNRDAEWDPVDRDPWREKAKEFGAVSKWVQKSHLRWVVKEKQSEERPGVTSDRGHEVNKKETLRWVVKEQKSDENRDGSQGDEVDASQSGRRPDRSESRSQTQRKWVVKKSGPTIVGGEEENEEMQVQRRQWADEEDGDVREDEKWGIGRKELASRLRSKKEKDKRLEPTPGKG